MFLLFILFFLKQPLFLEKPLKLLKMILKLHFDAAEFKNSFNLSLQTDVYLGYVKTVGEVIITTYVPFILLHT